MSTVQDTVGMPGSAVHFDAILHPNRSLSRGGFYILMSLVAAISATIGGFFYLSGAWPIFGFYGLDVVVLYFAFRQNYRRARMYEQVRLTEGALIVEKVDHRGGRRSWQFQPYWLRVNMDDPPRHESQVTLTSHGQAVIVGSFLSPEERLDFARALRAALDRQRQPVRPPVF